MLPAVSGDTARLRMLDLPTFDDLAPILLRTLDDDDAMSAFQLLVAAGYRIIRSERLDEAADALESFAAENERLRQQLASEHG